MEAATFEKLINVLSESAECTTALSIFTSALAMELHARDPELMKAVERRILALPVDPNVLPAGRELALRMSQIP